ncbi:HypC/HybG/HupF family hydrogenase formation chaperone [Aminobacterium mobile]|uniref:HypC/HybG/HupF family hydrogenase formation chaperone n=1 Tax=Aminobacterium mobile TaxID=81467 RepID=UPI003314F9F7
MVDKMCLAVPHQIKTLLDEHRAIAMAGSVQVEIRTDLLESVVIGDTVLVHAGFAIEKLEPNESAELQILWDEIYRYAGQDLEA